MNFMTDGESVYHFIVIVGYSRVVVISACHHDRTHLYTIDLDVYSLTGSRGYNGKDKDVGPGASEWKDNPLYDLPQRRPGM